MDPLKLILAINLIVGVSALIVGIVSLLNIWALRETVENVKPKESDLGNLCISTDRLNMAAANKRNINKILNLDNDNK